MSEEPVVATNGLVALSIPYPVPTPEPIIIPCELAVSDMALDMETESIVVIHENGV
nr:MAG TPA: hypothetical protein [Bacteriophage sp.]